MFGKRSETIEILTKEALSCSDESKQLDYVSRILNRINEKEAFPALEKIGKTTPYIPVLEIIVKELLGKEKTKYQNHQGYKGLDVLEQIIGNKTQITSYADVVSTTTKVLLAKSIDAMFNITKYSEFKPSAVLLNLSSRLCSEGKYAFDISEIRDLINLNLFPNIYKEAELISSDGNLTISHEQFELFSQAKVHSSENVDLLIQIINNNSIDEINEKLLVRVLALYHWRDSRVLNLLKARLQSESPSAVLQSFAWLLYRYTHSPNVVQLAINVLKETKNNQVYKTAWNFILGTEVHSLDRLEASTKDSFRYRASHCAQYAIYNHKDFIEIFISYLVQHNEKDEFFIADNAFLKTNFAFKKSSEFINQIAQTEQPGNKKFNKKFAEAEWLKRYVELQNNIQDYLLNKDHSHENITQLYLDAEYSDNTDSIEQKLLHPDYVLKTRQYLEDYLHTHRFRIDRRAFNWSSSPTGTIAQALKLLSESIWTTQEAIKFLSNLIDINYRLDITNEARRERCEQRQLEILVFLSKKYPSNEGLAKRIMAFKLLPFVESYRTNSLSYNFINCAGVADYLNGCIEDKPNRDNTNYIIENLSKNIGSNIETRKNVEIWLLANKELEAWKIFRNYAESVEGDGDSDVFMVKYIEEQIRQPDNSASASALMLSAYLLNMSTDRSAQMLCIEAAKHSSSTLAVAGIIWLSWGKPDSEKTLELLKELTINGHLADIRQNAFYCILIHFGKEKSVWSFLQKISTIETDSEVKKWINFWLTGDSPVYFKNRPWFRPQFHLTLSKAIKDYETIEFQLYCEALEANNIDASKITL